MPDTADVRQPADAASAGVAADPLAVHAGPHGFSRRALIGGAAATGAAAAASGLLAGLPAAARAAHPGPTAPIPPSPVPLFEDPMLTFQCLFAFAGAPYQSAEWGEVATAVKKINDAGESYAAFYAAFVAAARQATAIAREAEKRQSWVTARGAWLRAANYYCQALFFVLATSRPTRAHEREVYRAMRDRWERAGRLMQPRMQVLGIPWNGPRGPMPAWFLRPNARAEARPTLIMNNGSDAQMIDLWNFGGAEALQRGWNVLIFDGPGQGGMLFERNQTFVPQWERAVSPVVSYLRRRRDVDPDRIAIWGWSFGGELVPRAAAFERRLAAFAVDPGVVDAATTWKENLPAFFFQQLREGKKAQLNAEWADYLRGADAKTRFSIAKRLEIYPGATFYDQLKALLQFTVRDVAGRIRMPGLVTDNEIEQFFPGQPRALYRLLRNPRKGYVKFTVAQGAQYHCEPMAPQVRNAVVLDWLEQIVIR